MSQKFSIPEDPKTLLTRDLLSVALHASGFELSSHFLAILALTEGAGPPYTVARDENGGGRWKARYAWGPALKWAKARAAAQTRKPRKTAR